MNQLQTRFDSDSEACFRLEAGEYEGPLTVSRSCIIEGNSSVLWAARGPVLTVNAPGVIIKNLRVEVTEHGCEPTARKDAVSSDTETRIAVITRYADTRFENVEIHGTVSGIPGEPDGWEIPETVSLGSFAADAENSFSVSLESAVHASLVSEISQLRLTPPQLVPGNNRITVSVSPMRDRTILYGSVLIKSTVNRRLYITGKSEQNAPQKLPQEQGNTVITSSDSRTMVLPKDMTSPMAEDSAVRDLRRGERIPLDTALCASGLRFVLESDGSENGAETDCYVFLLCENGKVSGDEGLVFFGNRESADHAVCCDDSGGVQTVRIEPEKADSDLVRAVICYSVYGDDPTQNFSRVRQPVIRIFGEKKEVFRFALSGLSDVKTVTAMEMYRYKGQWKLSCVGAGYRSGLEKLCEEYGVEVEKA